MSAFDKLLGRIRRPYSARIKDGRYTPDSFHREDACDLLRAHGIDPRNVIEVSISEDTLVVEEVVVDEKGNPIRDNTHYPNEFQRRVRTVERRV